MRVLAGTSGFSYKEWKGSFYPEDLPAEKMLAYYAERLPAVEINNTFYRMPKPALLEGWAAQVPPEFRFVLKASQRITHRKRLKEAGEEVAYFFRTAATLGERLGPTLFQLPPNLKKDLPRLEAFLAVAARGRARRLRVPPRLVVRGRRVRGAARARRGALRRRGRGARDAARRDRGLGLPAPAAPGLRRRGGRAPGRRRSGARRGARPTSSSSTRTPGRGRGSRREFLRAASRSPAEAARGAPSRPRAGSVRRASARLKIGLQGQHRARAGRPSASSSAPAAS